MRARTCDLGKVIGGGLNGGPRRPRPTSWTTSPRSAPSTRPAPCPGTRWPRPPGSPSSTCSTRPPTPPPRCAAGPRPWPPTSPRRSTPRASPARCRWPPRWSGCTWATRPPADYDSARAADEKRYAALFHALLDRAWPWRRAHEVMFPGLAHTDESSPRWARWPSRPTRDAVRRALRLRLLGRQLGRVWPGERTVGPSGSRRRTRPARRAGLSPVPTPCTAPAAQVVEERPDLRIGWKSALASRRAGRA